MKKLTFIAIILLMVSCGNKKAEIVELIKKTKTELIVAQMHQKAYYRVSTKLLLYNNAVSDSKKYGDNEQMKAIAKIHKEAYETAVADLKEAPSNVLKDRKKLDSIAFVYEKKTWDLAHRLDSLELELKKY